MNPPASTSRGKGACRRKAMSRRRFDRAGPGLDRELRLYGVNGRRHRPDASGPAASAAAIVGFGRRYSMGMTSRGIPAPWRTPGSRAPAPCRRGAAPRDERPTLLNVGTVSRTARSVCPKRRTRSTATRRDVAAGMGEALGPGRRPMRSEDTNGDDRNRLSLLR